MSSSAAQSADRGGAAGGGVRVGSTLQLHKLFYFRPCREAALRLTVNPSARRRATPPISPLLRRHRGRHSSVAVCGLELRVKSEIGKRAMSSSAARKARIGEVPQAEGFCKNQRRNFAKFAGKPLCGCGPTPSARKLATSPISPLAWRHRGRHLQ